jgi:eukaryotic-like serine/threonine-protein kinase
VNKALRSIILMFCLLLALAGCGTSAKPTIIWQVDPYISSDKGHLFALDLVQRNVRWRFDTDGDLAPPAVADGVVYVGGRAGALYALDAASGKELWRFAAPAAVSTIPAITGDTIYTGDSDGRLYALDRATGAERWQIQLAGSITIHMDDAQGYIIPGHGLLYVSTSDNPSDHLYAIDPRSQRIVWSIDQDLGFISAPTVDDTGVYLGSFGSLWAFEPLTGAVKWRQEIDAGFGTPLVEGGRIYVGGTTISSKVKKMADDGAGIYALEAATGSLIWKYRAKDGSFSRPLLAGDRVYAATQVDAYSVEAATGKLVRIMEYINPVGPQPVLVQGQVLVGSGWGKIYQLGP